MCSDFRDPREISQKEKEEIAELLFNEVELRKKNKQNLPRPGELAMLAVHSFDYLRLSDAPTCVRLMEDKYAKELGKLGYKKIETEYKKKKSEYKKKK